MREIDVSEITKAVRQMCIDANYELENAQATEESELGKKIFSQLQENLKIAKEDQIPICQDTGMAVFFFKIGQDVHFTGGNLGDAINEGVRLGYTEGYLRKSVVGDPLIRKHLCATAQRGILELHHRAARLAGAARHPRTQRLLLHAPDLGGEEPAIFGRCVGRDLARRVFHLGLLRRHG